MSNLGFIRLAAATPKLKPANTEYNTEQILECLVAAEKAGCAIVVFPELCITGSTCGDLFYQGFLYKKSLEGLQQILDTSKKASSAIVLGLYVEIGCHRVNCAAFIQNGEIKGVVPKMFIGGAQSRWFVPGNGLCGKIKSANLMGVEVPFGNLLFKDSHSDAVVGIEISEDANHTVTPGAMLALNGANILLNPAACYHTAGKESRLKEHLLHESRKNRCGYIYASAGVHESTTDTVHSGQNMIAENGKLLSQSSLFNRDLTVLFGDIDVEMIRNERMRTQSFREVAAFYAGIPGITTVNIEPLRSFDAQKQTLLRTYAKNPFAPDSPLALAERCAEIFEMQCAGLAKRLEHTQSSKSVIGISGGLDSTLALLVCAATYKLLGKSTSDILTLTLPGFGTTDQTHHNAVEIMRLLGTEVREIPTRDSVTQHFKDIGHNINRHNVTYENAQARERTQILMDVANQENGIVIGTGDLSESALGWCTFNGDHMSMYNVNAGVPKTLARHIIRWIIDYKLNGPIGDQSFSLDNAELSYALEDILNTPISPELLPPDDSGTLIQKTEDAVGPYILHDFFLYYTVRHGFSPEKLLYLAKLAFAEDYSAEVIEKWFSVFHKRFFSQQFKRNCMPDGPKIGSVCLSPRGSLTMPSDADYTLF